MHASRVAVALSCLAMVACSTPSAPIPSGPPPDWKLASASMATGADFQGTASGGQISVRITGHSMSGPVCSLSVGGGHVRGTGNSGRTIDVSMTGNKAEGLVGVVPFSAIIEMAADGSAHVTGAMGAGNTDFTISPKSINGRIGVVTYQLGWNGTRYEGPMMPGGTGFLELPAVMATWSDIEAITVISLMLMGA